MNQNGKCLGAIPGIPEIRKTRKEKMGLGYRFKKWVRNWLSSDEPEQTRPARICESDDIDSNGPLRITIHKAAGGVVVETRIYDRVKDRSLQNLHIVTHDQNLGESIGKIIMMENLRS